MTQETLPVTEEEFIRRILPGLRLRQGGTVGVPFSKIDELFRRQFNFSSLGAVNRMIGHGSLIAAKPNQKKKGMRDAEILQSVSAEDCDRRYPILYLPDAVPFDLGNKLRTEVRKRKLIADALAGSGVPEFGGDNVFPIGKKK
jgi:hypothetical protein